MFSSRIIKIMGFLDPNFFLLKKKTHGNIFFKSILFLSYFCSKLVFSQKRIQYKLSFIIKIMGFLNPNHFSLKEKLMKLSTFSSRFIF